MSRYQSYTGEHCSRSTMEHSSNFSGARKHQNSFQYEYVEDPSIHHKREGYRAGFDCINPDPAPGRWLPVERETKSHHQDIQENNYWQPSQHPPSPPQEESQMTVLPSFSTLSKIADDGVRNSKSTQNRHRLRKTNPQLVDCHEVREHKPASQRKSNSLDSYHHHNYPPTPPLSLSSTTQSGSTSSPRSSAHCSFRQQLTPAPAPTYQFTCANTDSRPRSILPTHIMTNLEPQLLVSSPTTAKQHCSRSEVQFIQADYSDQMSHHKPSKLPEHNVGDYGAPTYLVPSNSTIQLSSFHTTPIGFEHHHYISPASASYPVPQERYNCPECGRAFSRPSSLKIHTYSHTGEKPFYCSVRGCNKNFSVRSNMKRHERGCHARKN